MDTVRVILKWLESRWRHSSTGMRIFYLLIGVIAVVLLFGTLSTTLLWSLFQNSHPTVQFSVFAAILLSVLVTSIFAWERGNRAEILKKEHDNLLSEVERMRQESAEKDHEIKQLEARWDNLCDVEARENLWQRPIACKPAPFIQPQERGSKTRFLSILNLKGGVGKTTLAGNLAASLALSDRPLRVLLIDIDFQGTLGDASVDPGLLNLQAANGNTSARLLTDGALNLNGLQLPMNRVAAVRVVASSDALESEDYRLQARYYVDESHEIRFRFRAHLHREDVFKAFDLVIFDCPPRLTTSAINALTCSDFILIPTKLDLGSMNAVPRTIKWLQTLQNLLHGRLVAVVANHVRFHAGKLTKADADSYNYLKQLVQTFTGDGNLLLKSTVLGHRDAVSEEKGVAACVRSEGLALYAPFVHELRERMQL